MKLNFKSIAHMLYTSFLSIVAFMIIILVISFLSASMTNKKADRITEEQLPNILLIESLSHNFNKRVEVSYEYLVTNNEGRITQFEELVAKGHEIEAKLLEGTISEELQFAIEKSNFWTTEVRENVLEQNLIGNELIASSYLNSFKPETIQVNNAFDDIIARIEAEIEEETDSLQRIQLISVIVTLALGVIGVILSLIISYRSTDSLTGRIGLIKERLERIADGDFSSGPLAIESKDELGDLGRSLNVTQDYLIMLIKNIQNVSQTLDGSSNELYATGEEVQQGTQQIAATMEELASGTELQANSASNLANEMNSFAETTEETLRYGEEITVSSNQIVTRAQNGNTLMSQSSKQMSTINGVVAQAVSQMTQLNQQTGEISNLVDIIQRIATQTNLLALNASIEAARAGEQGRGFAVVADEVRELAEGVAKSVTEITSYVASIQENANLVSKSLEDVRADVDLGTDHINATDKTLAEITVSIEQLQSQNQQMAENLNNISERSSEMNTLIDEIASISQESAAGVEETTASVEEINSSMEEVGQQSETLLNITGDLREFTSNVKI